MPSLSLKTKFGGGAVVPIRGIQEFSSDTPLDYSTPSGERFLRRGVVETDTLQFDTGIWNQTWGIVIDRNADATKISQGSSDTHAKSAQYSSVANEVLIVNGQSTLSQSASLISTDGGDTFNTTAIFPTEADRGAQAEPVHSQGNWSVPASASTDVMVTADSGASWTEYPTGLGGNIIGHMGNETAIVVWTSSGVGRRSIDGGLTWSNTTGATFSNLWDNWVIIGSDWYIFDSNDLLKSTDDGASWTQHNNVLPTSSAVWSDGTKLYQHALTASFPTTLHDSTDGLTWSNLEIPVDLSGDFEEVVVDVQDKVIRIGDLFILGTTDSSSGAAYFSKDAINWKPYVNNADGNGMSISYRSGGDAIIYNTNFSIDTIDNTLFAGDYEFSSEPAGQRLKWVRIS